MDPPRPPYSRLVARGRSLRRPLTGSGSPAQLRELVDAEAARVAELGEWPDWISPASLTERVPLGSAAAPGFDAGIACCLGLIPPARQRLAARLHAAYTPQAVAQVRREATPMHPESDTTWWLAACSVCREGEVDAAMFAAQVQEFTLLAGDPAARRRAAVAEHQAMLARFAVRPDGLAIADVDGGMQGAYLAGHRAAAMWAQQAGIFFVGTYEKSLGLEDFDWSEPADPDASDPARRLGRSGPVHGSRQFVKCADEAELERVVARLRRGGLISRRPPR